MSSCGVLRLLEPVCGVQQQCTASASNAGAELCGETLDVLWKETAHDIASVVHLLQKVVVFGQQSEYASCKTPVLNSLKL